MLSAYKAVFSPRLPTWIPQTTVDACKARAMDSIMRVNSPGEKGQPWRVPLEIVKKPNTSLLILLTTRGLFIQQIDPLKKDRAKLILFKTTFR